MSAIDDYSEDYESIYDQVRGEREEKEEVILLWGEDCTVQ